MAKGRNPGIRVPAPNEVHSNVILAIQQIINKFGKLSSPTFASLTLSGLTASRLVSSSASNVLSSVTNLTSWISGTTNEINVADDGDGTVTIGLVDPLIVGKGGIGVATLTDHGILLGSGTDAITPLGVAINGQLPIGSTGADPVLATLTEGEGIDVTNAAGSITISGEDASTTNKGIASLSGTYFTVASGVVSLVAGGGLNHYDLGSIQGGTTNEYYHLTSAEYTELTGWLDNVTLASNGVTDWSIINTVAGGEQGLNLDFVQGTNALTGTLRGVYSVVTNGIFASSGTIRAGEFKARAALSDLTGGNVAVLEGISASADAKDKTVTTLRGAEIILAGVTGASVTEAVGIRIANNFQDTIATTQYGLQFYVDSTQNTADIQLSSGGLIGGSTGKLQVNTTGVGIGTTASYLGDVRQTLSSATWMLNFVGTGAGSDSTNRTAIYAALNAGYTGDRITQVTAFENFSAGTGNTYAVLSGYGYSIYRANRGMYCASTGTTTGINAAGLYMAANGNTNYGCFGTATVDKNSATNVGIWGTGRNTGTSPVEIGGAFTLWATTGSAPTWTSAALLADNCSSTSPIFVARDNGTTLFSIKDGGGVFIKEQAAANTDTAGEGQLWVKSDTPNTPYFTDDAGTDYPLIPITSEMANKTVNLDSSMTAAEIQALISACGKYIGPDVTLIFQFADGTYTLDAPLTFRGFFGPGTVAVYGNRTETDHDALHTTQAVYIDVSSVNGAGIYILQCMCFAGVYNFKVKIKSDSGMTDCGIYVQQCYFVSVRYSYVLGTSTTNGCGIFFNDTAIGNAQQNYVSNVKYGVALSEGVLFSRGNDDTGTMPLYGLYARYAGTIGKYDTGQPDGSTADELAQYGAVIR